MLSGLELGKQRPELKGLDLHRDAEGAQLRLDDLSGSGPGVDGRGVQHEGERLAVLLEHAVGTGLPSRLRQERLGLAGIVFWSVFFDAVPVPPDRGWQRPRRNFPKPLQPICSTLFFSMA